MISLARLALFLGLPLRALLKWSVIKVLFSFLAASTVAGGRFSGAMAMSFEFFLLEDVLK
jgi:hypothetical protein